MKRHALSQNSAKQKSKKNNEPNIKQQLVDYLKNNNDLLLANAINEGQKVTFKSSQHLNLEGIDLLIKALTLNIDNIIGIDLRYHRRPVNEINKIVYALKYNTNIEILDLSGNYSVMYGNILSFEKLPECLTKLSFNSCALGDQGMKTIAGALKLTPNITYLDLGLNMAKSEGMEAIANALKLLINLTHLDLSGNNPKLKEIEATAEALKLMSNLTYLNLSNGWGSEVGMLGISEAIPLLPNLVTLNLYCNRMLMEDMKNIIKAIEDHPSLAVINLSGNKLGGEGVRFIISAIPNIPNISRFILYNNELRKLDVEYVAKFLKKNFAIIEMTVMDFMESSKDRVIQEINSYTARNKKILEGAINFVDKYFSNNFTLKSIPIAKYQNFVQYQSASKSEIKQELKKLNKPVGNEVFKKTTMMIKENYFLLSGICKEVALLNEDNQCFKKNTAIREGNDILNHNQLKLVG